MTNLIGRTFKKLTVIEKTTHNGRTTYACKCECGNIIKVSKYNLLHRHQAGCGECVTLKMVGKKYTKLTVLEILNPTGKGVYVKCKCDCGNEVSVAARRIRTGDTKSCGCLRSSAVIKRNKNRTLKDGEAAFHSLYKRYIRGAAKRNYTFELSIDTFKELTKSSCHYCGAEPSQTVTTSSNPAPYIYNGLDRVDNMVGYEEGNVVSCCKFCNRAKDIMGAEEFISHCKRVADHNK